MSAAPASRAVLRQSRLLMRRNNFRQASTASDAAAKAQETGKQAASKASEGLSRVQSSAGAALTRVGSSAYGALGALSRVGGRTGRAISFVESLIPPTVYYSRVGFELARIVVKGQQMAPPTVAQFQSYFQPLINVFRNPRTIVSAASSATSSVNPGAMLSSIRNANSKQIATVGIIFAEVLGFFTVGEMVGRWKLVGYHGEPHHEH